VAAILGLLVLALLGGGMALLLGGDDDGAPERVAAPGPVDAVSDDPDGNDGPDDTPDDPDPDPAGGLSAQELGERFGDAVFRVEVDGCGFSGSGTAFAIAEDLLVTNAHVVDVDPTPRLVARDGTSRDGTVIGLRDWPDLAVIQVAGPLDVWLDWAPTEELTEGQAVTALSYPTPLLTFSVAPGTLMSFQVEDGRRIALASDEITDYGSSGGPLLDDQGRVAGVVTEFAAGDGRQLVGLSYTYAFLQEHLDAIIAAPATVTADCGGIDVPDLPDGWLDDGDWWDPSVDAYGSDPGLDALWDACEGGEMQACDDLFRYSPVGSAYEAYGDSCGERNEPAGWCVDIHGGAPASADLPDGYGDDPVLDGLWDACAGGDWAGCDQLFADSPLGSAYERFGDSCGERNEPAGWCEDLYG
jgi:S1-C subfamily serine protease